MSRLALFIDGENIASRHFPEIARQCLQLGELGSAQVFADFSAGRRAGWLEVAAEYGVKPVLQLSGGAGKNSTDIAMTIAAMDSLHDGHFGIVCLVSSDRDFVPLAQRLRSGGLLVVGIGLAAADARLAESCDRYFLLPALEKAKPGAAAAELSRDERAFMRDLIDELCRMEGKASVSPAAVGLELKRRNAALAERIGAGKLLKRLRQHALVVEHGDGPAKTISAARAA